MRVIKRDNILSPELLPSPGISRGSFNVHHFLRDIVILWSPPLSSFVLLSLHWAPLAAHLESLDTSAERLRSRPFLIHCRVSPGHLYLLVLPLLIFLCRIFILLASSFFQLFILQNVTWVYYGETRGNTTTWRAVSWQTESAMQWPTMTGFGNTDVLVTDRGVCDIYMVVMGKGG